MAKCRIKRGFFLLRDCGLAATRTCEACGRRACDEHSAVARGFDLCTDCHARQLQEEPEVDAPGWSERLRDRYYRSTGYAPFYVAHHPDAYYDAYDVRAFDRDMLEAPEVDIDAEGGFFDS